jgi:hypothetical protein
MSNAGLNYSQGVKDIQMQSAQMGRQRRSQLEGMWGGAAGNSQYEPGQDLGGIFGQLGGLYAQHKGLQNIPTPWQMPGQMPQAQNPFNSSIFDYARRTGLGGRY